MFNKKNINRKRKKRFARGAIIAEHAGVLYVLFFLLFFPLVDLASMGLRTFLLWYACNQAAMAGCKGSQWTATATMNGISSGNYYTTSMQTQAINALTQVVSSYTGIAVNSGYPVLSVYLAAIQHSDTTNNPSDQSSVPIPAGSLPLSSGSKAPIPSSVDTSQYVPFFRVTVQGTIQPFIIVPFFFNVPGLTSPFQVTITADQVIENAAALNT